MEHTYTFDSFADLKDKSFEVTNDHFDEFLKEFPSVISEHFEDKENEINLVLQERDDLHKKELLKRESMLQDQLLLKEEQLKLSVEEKYKKDTETSVLRLKKEFESKQLDQQKVFDEYVKANENKTGTHSMYKGESFEKYIELGIVNKFDHSYDINGDGSNFCMDIRMTDSNHSSNVIGIECKSKGSITSNDIKKFNKDKVSNNFYACVFISEDKPIPNRTTNTNDWSINGNELWIQSNDINVITSSISSFLNLLQKDEDSDDADDKQTIIKQRDFIASMYDKVHSQKQCLLEQEKSLYHWAKVNYPAKLRNHLYIVSGYKLTKKHKDMPY
jgi:uncharacterized protein YqgQ